MSEMLPSESDVSSEQTGELQTLWLDSDEAGELLSSLSSETTRSVLTALHDEPATASEVAERLDTSVQNARHHLGKLQDAGLIRVADTRYSSKGREMDVYAPAEEPMVVLVGNRDDSGLLDSLRELVPAVGALALASLLVQALTQPRTGTVAGELPRVGQGMGETTVGLGVPPGLLFFAGGLFVLFVALAVHRTTT